jgi:hypothetical protein
VRNSGKGGLPTKADFASSKVTGPNLLAAGLLLEIRRYGIARDILRGLLRWERPRCFGATVDRKGKAPPLDRYVRTARRDVRFILGGRLIARVGPVVVYKNGILCGFLSPGCA